MKETLDILLIDNKDERFGPNNFGGYDVLRISYENLNQVNLKALLEYNKWGKEKIIVINKSEEELLNCKYTEQLKRAYNLGFNNCQHFNNDLVHFPDSYKL